MIVHVVVRRLDSVKRRYVEKLPNMVWEYITTPRTATKETPLSLVYSLEAVIPLELMVLIEKTTNYDKKNQR